MFVAVLAQRGGLWHEHHKGEPYEKTEQDKDCDGTDLVDRLRHKAIALRRRADGRSFAGLVGIPVLAVALGIGPHLALISGRSRGLDDALR